MPRPAMDTAPVRRAPEALNAALQELEARQLRRRRVVAAPLPAAEAETAKKGKGTLKDLIYTPDAWQVG